MNEGNSAGGGHAGLSPAPPAVPDRVTLQSTEQSVTTPKLPQTTPQPPPPTASFSNASSSFDTKPLPSAQLPKPLSPFQQEQPTTEATAATPAAALGYTSTSPPQAKRQRLDNESIVGTVAANSSNIVGSLLPASVVAASTEIASPALQDLNALKKRILQQKLQILRNLKERHLENVSEYFYLQNGGSMMDYPAWRKKTPTPQFISYSNANRIDQLIHQEEKPTTSTAAAIAAVGAAVQPTETTNIIALGSTIGQQVVVSDGLKTNTQSQLPSSGSGSPLTSTIISNSEAGGVGANVLPPEAEIKIPAVGATPVAISTKLPAAVVQLTQQGHIPGRPLGGRHGMVFGQIPAPPAIGNSSVPLVPGAYRSQKNKQKN